MKKKLNNFVNNKVQCYKIENSKPTKVIIHLFSLIKQNVAWNQIIMFKHVIPGVDLGWGPWPNDFRSGPKDLRAWGLEGLPNFGNPFIVFLMLGPTYLAG